MNDMLSLFGKVAGLGGLALGVFLILFRKVKLPPGTRRHLTLFMWLVWSIAVLGMGVYAFERLQRPADGDTRDELKSRIPSFTGIIAISYPDPDFLEFLDSHDPKLVHLDATIDLSVSTADQSERIARLSRDRETGIIDDFIDDPGSVFLELPAEEPVFLKIALLNNRKLPSSHGGTGIVLFPIKGFFEVTKTHTGASTTYYLAEIEAPIEMRARFGR